MTVKVICDACKDKTFDWVSYDHWPEDIKICSDCWNAWIAVKEKIGE